jgi:lysophospholipid acyltransferase (LPLAT)-like uncharacterized protein
VKHETQAQLLATVGGVIMRLWLRTVRFQVIDRAGVLAGIDDQPRLWVFWHNRLFVMAYVFARWFPRQRGAALASASKDGEILTALLQQFGIRAIRGSSSRGGARALVEMKHAMDDGYVLAIAPDGPRGPRYVLNPGVAKLAQLTGGHVLPIHVRYSSYWQLKSWDGFMLPKPFSRADITFGPAHPVPRTADAPAFEAQRLALENVLREEAADSCR